jgi:hypothetical protein
VKAKQHTEESLTQVSRKSRHRARIIRSPLDVPVQETIATIAKSFHATMAPCPMPDHISGVTYSTGGGSTITCNASGKQR